MLTRQQYYIAIIREETTQTVEDMSIQAKAELAKLASDTDGYWGYFWREVGYSIGPEFDRLSLAEAANKEWAAMDHILRRALSRNQNCGGNANSGDDSGNA